VSAVELVRLTAYTGDSSDTYPGRTPRPSFPYYVNPAHVVTTVNTANGGVMRVTQHPDDVLDALIGI
jgi:hypothetical protein